MFYVQIRYATIILHKSSESMYAHKSTTEPIFFFRLVETGGETVPI